jgi:hypothetical protein
MKKLFTVSNHHQQLIMATTYKEPNDYPQSHRHHHRARPHRKLRDKQALGTVASQFESTLRFTSPVRSPMEAVETPIKDPSALPSRASALVRRCEALKNSVAHLHAVVKPLRDINLGDLTDGHVFDVQQEASNVSYAFRELEAQVNEVEAILDDIKKRREKGRQRGRRSAWTVVVERGL